MLLQQADAGNAGRPGILPNVVLDGGNIQGDGSLRIDGSSERIIWQGNQYHDFTLYSQDSDGGGETIYALERFKADAVVFSELDNPRFDTASIEDFGDVSESSHEEKAQHIRAKYDAYLARMKLLKDEAANDGYVLNLASEIDFRQFIKSVPEVRRGNLVLMDNGNLRAVWKDKQGTRLGLQFLGGSMVQYVIFKQRKQGQQISRVAGRDSLEEIKRQIDVFELHSLLKE